MLAALGVSSHEPREVRDAAGGLELPGTLQVLGDGYRVGRLVARDELRDRAEDQPMIGAVEILGDHDVRDLVPRALIQHQPAEQRLLGLDRVRRQAELIRGRECGSRG